MPIADRTQIIAAIESLPDATLNELRSFISKLERKTAPATTSATTGQETALSITESAIAKNVVEILNAAFQLSINPEAPDAEREEYSWMKAFDREDMHELATEISAAYRCAAFEPDGWENLRAVIHEWHESAIAILSADLKEAWQS